MAELLVQIRGEVASGAVSLPKDAPLSEFVPSLARRYAPSACSDPVVEVDGRPLDLHAPLGTQVADGAELRIRRRSAPAPSPDQPAPAELGVSVVGSNGRRAVVRVPAEVPMRSLVAQLSAAVGIAEVADVRLADGTLVPPGSSLASLGARSGTALHVRALGDPLPAPPTPPRRRWRVALAAGAALAAGLGGAALGRASAPDASRPPALLVRASQDWLAARADVQPAWPGVSRRLGRRGALDGRLEPAGTWRIGGEEGAAWIVAKPKGAPFGLVAVAYGDRLGYDPTPVPLPLAIGKTPPVGGQLLAHPGQPPGALGEWEQATFGPHGLLTGVLGMGALGRPRVLAAYRPSTGGIVWRVRVRLGSAAPGTPASLAAAAAAQAERVAAAAQETVDSAKAELGSAAAALASAAPAAKAGAQAALAGAQAALARDEAAASAAESKAASAKASVPTGSLDALGTYDVWVRHGSVVGWSAAGYGGGES